MKQKINHTDLHIQYKMETGKHFQWSGYKDSKDKRYEYNSSDGYEWDYSKWMEEKYLELLNKDRDEKIQKEEMLRKIDELEQQIVELEK